MTSTIGIPIKLLNEAQVRSLLSLNLAHLTFPGSCRHSRNHIRPSVSGQAPRSRRQHERATQRHHRHGARRARLTSRSGLHPRLARALLHRAGYVAQCAHVQKQGHARTGCWYGERKGDGEQGERAERWARSMMDEFRQDGVGTG